MIKSQGNMRPIPYYTAINMTIIENQPQDLYIALEYRMFHVIHVSRESQPNMPSIKYFYLKLIKISRVTQ